MCMVMRSVPKSSALAATSCVLGCFKTDEKTRNEFLALVVQAGYRSNARMVVNRDSSCRVGAIPSNGVPLGMSRIRFLSNWSFMFPPLNRRANMDLN